MIIFYSLSFSEVDFGFLISILFQWYINMVDVIYADFDFGWFLEYETCDM